jgi:hypothetical protein
MHLDNLLARLGSLTVDLRFLRFGCFRMSRGVLLRPVVILFSWGKKRLEAVVNLSQFPENRNKQNCDYEQQEFDNHFLAFRGKK